MDPSGLWSLKSAWNSFTNWVEEKVVDPVVEAYQEVKQAVVEAYNDAKDVVVEACNEVIDVAADVYNYVADRAVEVCNDVADKAVDAYNYVTDGATKLYDSVSNKAVDAYNAIKDGATDVLNDAKKNIKEEIIQPTQRIIALKGQDARNEIRRIFKKSLASFLYAIEIKGNSGYGLGVAIEDFGADASKSIVVGVDNGKTYCGQEVNAQVGIGVVSFSSTHTLLMEDNSSTYYDNEYIYEPKKVGDFLWGSGAIHNNSVNVGPFSLNLNNGDISVSFRESAYLGVGASGTVGINLSEFFRGVIE